MIEKRPQQRRFPRVDMHLPVRYQRRGYPEMDSTLSEDISIQGLRLVADRFIAPRTPLSVEINLPAHILRLTGRIAWVSSMAHSDRTRLGIEFVELDPNDRISLANYITGHIAKRKREQREA